MNESNNEPARDKKTTGQTLGCLFGGVIAFFAIGVLAIALLWFLSGA